MQKLVPLLLLLLLFTCFLQAQHNSFFWSKLKNIPGNHVLINPGPEFRESEFDTAKKNMYAFPLKVGKDIYCWIGATGRVYKMDEPISDSGYYFKRIDLTEAALYNINAFPFVYKKSIFTLGGAGIWRNNGQLRKYNERAFEWDIVKLNKEIPVIWGGEVSCLWYNPDKGKIYIGFYMPKNEALKEEFTPIPEVYILDLENNEWQKLGQLNAEFVPYMNEFKTYAMSPKGLLNRIRENIYFFNFEENKIYKFSKSSPRWETLIRSFMGKTLFFQDSVLFAHNTAKNSFDSVRIHPEDFELTTIPLYKKQRPPFFYLYFLIPALLSIVLFVAFRYRKNASTIHTVSSLKEQIDAIVLSASEIEVLNLICTNSTEGRTTTIEELNILLGLSKKNIDIQKKQRSDVLLSINRKMSVLSTEINKPIIEKVRSETDKRVFEYYIDQALLDDVTAFMLSKRAV